MRTTVHDWAWIAATVLAVSVGCKVGNPLDRTVRVTQQPSTDDLNSPSPRTRLASSAIKRGLEMPVNGDEASESNVSPHEGVVQASAKSTTAATAVARKAPAPSPKPTQPASKTAVANNHPAAPNAKPTIKNSAGEEVDLPAEYVELLDAFRDSPPEVQQQALRQLLAVSGQGLKRTQSPEGIAAALQSTVDDLPTLPEDFPDAESLPVRLATSPPPSDQASKQTVATALAEAPVSTPDEVEAEGEDVVVAAELPTELAQTGDAGSATMARDWAVKPASATSDAKAIAPRATTEPAPTASDAAKSLASSTQEELYAELVQRLQQASPGESDADRYRRHIIARHLMIFSGDPDAAVAPIEGMTDKEQEFLRHHLLGMWSMVDTAGHPVAARRWSAALPEMRQATQQLSSAAEALDVRALAFCREIQSYGQTTKFDSSRFEAGQKVILYCEIDNFVAEKTQAGFETHLQGSYEVFDGKGNKVAGQVLPADQQVCANHLRDYFIAYQMGLPSGLEPGTYRMQLTMECMKGQKYGQASIPFEIGKSAAK